MKFGIVTAKEYPAAQELESKVKKYLADKKHQVQESKFAEVDVILSLGGDGILIHTACNHAEVNAPIFGVNAGTLGFLTAAEGGEWKEALDRIIKGDYVLSERMMLEAEIADGKRQTAVSSKRSAVSYRSLNEVVVKGMYRVIDLEVVVNGQKFLDISGDGVIVSTPTGSTAYSLSAGGPIVDPELDSIGVVPISVVGLPVASVILSPDDEVVINIKKGDDVFLAIDGQKHVGVTEGQSIRVYRGKYRVKFGYFEKNYFLKALNAKFGLTGRIAK